MSAFTKIKPPKYKVGKYTLNEYELRLLMLEVAINKKSQEGLVVKDEYGRTAEIKSDGSLSGPIFGLGICSSLSIAHIQYRANKDVAKLGSACNTIVRILDRDENY